MNVTLSLPTQIAHRTASCFPGGGGGGKTPEGPKGDVEFSYNPQDQVHMEPGTTIVHDVGNGPSVEKAAIKSDFPSPKNDSYVYDTSDSRYYAANTFSATAKTIEVFEEAYGEPIQWAFRSPQLTVNPDKGEMLNAYYSRNEGSINFFHSFDNVFNRDVYSGGSGEVVAHETGHAILDGLRPGYLGTWSPAPGGFHESFGDVLAMLVSLGDERVLDKVIEQTGGDLSQPNVAAYLGEELGMAINNSQGSNVTGGDYTRNAINDFQWQDPSTLPGRAPHDQLSKQVHSYSRLWTGSFYDVFQGMHQSYMDGGMDAKEALAAARDEGLKLYGALMHEAPHGNHTYRDMAEALLRADANANGGSRSDLITTVMQERRILPQSFGLNQVNMSTPTGELRTLEVTLKGQEYGQFEGAVVRTPIDSNMSLASDGQRRSELADDVLGHIQAGRVLFTTPGQQLSEQDYFDQDGNPYMGVVRWESGQMEIERLPILANSF